VVNPQAAVVVRVLLVSTTSAKCGARMERTTGNLELILTNPSQSGFTSGALEDAVAWTAAAVTAMAAAVVDWQLAN
tara:strand:- start:758 stop:985 length:228 start_codon:yes stop_codon:yes gene_type:complete